MRQWKRAWVLALALVEWRQIGTAQALPGPLEPEAVLSTRFLTPLTYEGALARLGAYYQEQVGRILPVAFPEIAPRCHFEVWHDIWVFFGPAGARTMVTLKRPTEKITGRLVKSWMVELAGRLEADMPLDFREEPALHEVEADIEASRNDLSRVLGTSASMKSVATWEHAGMMVSAAPLSWVVLTPAGLRGGHRVKVAAESALDARQLLAKLMQGVLQPGIYAAYSEEVELQGEVRSLASGKSAGAGAASSQAVYIPNMDQKYMENRVRAEPEMIRRSAAAMGQYAVRFRVDKSYRKVTVSWVQLDGYARASGRFAGQTALGQSVLSGPKPPPGAGLLTARTKLPALAVGAYRVRLEGEAADGQSGKIDERCYWFDGKTFEEP